MKKGSVKILAIAAPIIWAAIVFLLHVVKIPQEHAPRISIPHADKLVHFTMFGVLAFLCWRSFIYLKQRKTQQQWVLVLLFCLSYGAALEWIQSISGTSRDSDVFDWVADFAGTIFGLWIAHTRFLLILFRHQFRESSENF